MTTTTVTDALPSKQEAIVRTGRVAIGTQGVLYVILGLLAMQVASGDQGEKAKINEERSKRWPVSRSGVP